MERKWVKRRPPTFWWKFEGPCLDVVVKSDWPGGQCLARFVAPEGARYRDTQIEAAENLIKEYESGRVTPPWGKTV